MSRRTNKALPTDDYLPRIADGMLELTLRSSGATNIRGPNGAVRPRRASAHHGALTRRFRLDIHDGREDHLPLEGISSTDCIETFRRKPHPMCIFCDNRALSVMPWERSELSADEWLSPMQGSS